MIYVDASRYNNTAKRTGVENYSYFLINELVRQAPGQITLISPRKVPLKVPQIIIPFRRLWTQVRLSWEVLWNKKIKTLFIPSHVMPVIHPKKTIITIHDVAFKNDPKSYGLLSRLYLNWGSKFAVRHAKNIIVPSQTTKADLVKWYKADPKKITVIPLGFETPKTVVGKKEEVIILRRCKLKPKNYFLYLGRIERKKNTDTLIKAFLRIADSNPEIKLVLAGFLGRGGKNILKLIPQFMKKRIIITGYINEKEKHVLFKNAFCFVFPSRYEGFGLPLLEAMHYVLPIIASRIPTSYEIAKRHALFFRPEVYEELAKHMEHIVQNDFLKKQLTMGIGETLKQYSWRNSAKKLLRILKKN